MARCQCAGTQCSCFITGGDGIEVTGSGGKGDGYVISSTTGDLSDSLLVDNTGHNVDLVLVGDGTQTNPAVLGADARLNMVDLLDVQDDEGPHQNDVPVWTIDHWEFRPAPALTPNIATTDLSDVADAQPTVNGQVLAWNGTQYVPTTPAGAVPLTVLDTTTVDLTLTAGNQLSAAATLKLANLTDVVDTPPSTVGQVPRWDGTQYVPTVPTVPTPLTVADTPTLDLTLTGGNVLSGVPTLKMADLTDVVDAPAPTSGQVPTWNGSAYAPATPSVPPGTVNTANGIGGDGSAATPVVARTSGVWPLTGFPASQGSQTGSEIYVDSVGLLRAKPDIIPVVKPVTDLVNTYPVGVTVMSLDAAAGASWPVGQSGQVVTERRQESTGAQWCYNNVSSGTSLAWMRTGTGSGWGDWVAMGTVNVGAGILGTGSVGSPVRLATSGVWGSSPLDLFGAASIIGDPVYIDSAGQVRARGHALPLESHPVTDLHTAYPTGLTVMDLNNTYAAANGWTKSSHVLTVRRNDGSSAVQFQNLFDGTNPSLMWRSTIAANAWGPWMTVYLAAEEIPGSADLNTYTRPGQYTQSQNTEAASGTNYPAPYAGMLEVGSNTNNSMMWQRYTTYSEAGSSKVDGDSTYQRAYYASGVGWGPWIQIAGDSGWVDISVQAGYTIQGTEKPQVRKVNGVVYSRGGWSSTGMTASSTQDPIGTVPAGYRPTQNVIHRAGSTSGAAVAELFINSAGNVSARIGATSTYVMLGATWLTS